MATFRKRNNRWYVEVKRKGQYHAKTFRTKMQGRIWADGLEESIDRGDAVSQSLIAGLRRYSREVSSGRKGAKWEQIRLRRFEEVLPFAGKNMRNIQPDEIGQWVQARLSDRITAGTIRRELVLLGSVFEHARKVWRWIRENPVRDVPKPPVPQPRQRIISDSEVDRLFEACGYVRGESIVTKTQLVAASLDFALQTAMRAGEIRGLTGDDVDLRARVAVLPETKNGSRREVPLSRAAVEILKSLDRRHPFPIVAASHSTLFKKLRERAGLSGFTFHDSRATAITRLSKKLDIYELSRMTGHKDIRQLANYYRESASSIARRLD